MSRNTPWLFRPVLARKPLTKMLISGIQKFTLLDFPDKTACIVFTPGCNFRCGFCHNPEFVLPELIAKMKDSFIPEEAVLNFLTARQNLLQGVVVTGGEPTLQPDLLSFLKKVKTMGFLVKLDTNGSRSAILETLLAEKVVDYIAMDIKTSAKEYQSIAGVAVIDDVKRSIELIKNSGLPYEFRSTLVKELHSKEALEGMAKLLQGAQKFYLQTFRPGHTLDAKFASYHPFSEADMEQMANDFRKVADNVGVRG